MHAPYVAFTVLAAGMMTLPIPGHARYEKSIAVCRAPAPSQRAALEELARAVEMTWPGDNCTELYKKLSKKNELVLTKSKHIQDLTPLRELTHVTALTLSKNKISDLAPIADFKKLKSLTVAHNEIRDISLVRNLKRLTDLDISGNPVADIGGIATLTELKTLFLNNIRGAASAATPLELQPLARLSKLKFLALGNNNIVDISALRGLTNLESLNLANNNLAEINTLAALTNMRNLNISANQVKDISVLKSLSRLEVLMAADNRLSDIAPLVGLANIYELDVSKNAFIDIAPLARSPSLKNKLGFNLNAQGNPLRDCSPKNLADLQAGVRCNRAAAAHIEVK